MAISVVFIIATLFVYGCIPKLRNLNGRCLVHYLSVLAIGYTSIAWVQIYVKDFVDPLICHAVGYIIYFTFMSAFFWLSVINFDFWLNAKLMVLKMAPNQCRMSPLLVW